MKLSSVMSKRFTFSVELKPPQSPDIGLFQKKLEKLEENKIPVITVPEISDAKSSLSGLLCLSTMTDSSFEKVYELPTRDMNSLALESHLLSARSMEIDNVLATEGILPAEDKDVVYELDSMSLLDKMNSFQGFCPGIFLNPYAHMEVESRRVWSKLEAGAEFIRTLPVFDPSRISRFVREYESLTGEDIRDLIMVSIIPPEDQEHLNRLKDKYNYIIPRRVFNQIKQADEQKGVQMSLEWIEEARGKGFGGIHLHESSLTDKVISQM